MLLGYSKIMELRHLRYFVAVAEALSFSKAAGQLRVAQPAVSRQIADLEEEVGTSLMQRNNRVVRLTAAGQAFLKDAKKMLDQAEAATERARRVARGEVGELNIAFLGAPTMIFLPALVKAYRRQFPEVTVNLFEMLPERQLAAFTEGRLHVGFSRPLPAPSHQGLRSELVLHEALQAVAPETHPLVRKKRVGLVDLSMYPFVLLDRNEMKGVFDRIIAACRAAGFSPSIVNAPNLMATVLTLVAAEQGVSVVPESVRNLRSEGIVFLNLQPKLEPIPLVMIWDDALDSPPRAAFQRLVREQLKDIRQHFVK